MVNDEVDRSFDLIFPNKVRDESTIIRLMVAHLMRMPAPFFALRKTPTEHDWTLYMSAECWKFLEQVAGI